MMKPTGMLIGCLLFIALSCSTAEESPVDESGVIDNAVPADADAVVSDASDPTPDGGDEAVDETPDESSDEVVDEPVTDETPDEVEIDPDDDGVIDPGDGWLHTDGNRIRDHAGAVWQGHGANIHDTRSCWSCAWNEPDPGEVMRRIDTLVDDWGADFLRLDLESYAEPSDEYMIQWQGVLDDEEYLADIVEIVDHIGTKPGVYVLVSLWVEPTVTDLGWPTAATNEVWKKLAETFAFAPHVLYGIINEPESNYDGSRDAEVWQAMNDAVGAIRAVEEELGAPHHIVAVQGTGGWSRFLQYYIDHPITAGNSENIAYEVHVYDPQSTFGDRFVTPSATLPVIIGEFGPVAEADMTEADCSALIAQAAAHEVPWLAWTFHSNCPPNLLEATESGCGVGMELRPTSWGELIKTALASD
ncbi:MAG TPA: cellulase family glycosylhydrolase [bacterium]|nr:cellulase family glycosylhydrolase [bacterium]